MRLVCQGWLDCSVRRRSQWRGCNCTVSRLCADCCTAVSGKYGARKPTCRVQSFLRTPEAFWAASVEGGNGCDLLCAGLILTRTGEYPLCLLFHFLSEVTTHAEPQHLMCAGVVNLACMYAVCIEYVILRYPLVFTPFAELDAGGVVCVFWFAERQGEPRVLCMEHAGFYPYLMC